jgi:hypothetical protein
MRPRTVNTVSAVDAFVAVLGPDQLLDNVGRRRGNAGAALGRVAP